MADTLVNRLRGIYTVGPDNNSYGTRSFADFIPPISLEAANRIDALEFALNDLLNDCINFDGGKLSDSVLLSSSKTLHSKK